MDIHKQAMLHRATSSNTQGTVVRDSAVILLEGKIISANDYIYLYDTTPYVVENSLHDKDWTNSCEAPM
jgi:hypothetical protein